MAATNVARSCGARAEHAQEKAGFKLAILLCAFG